MPGNPHTVRSFDHDINRLNQTIAHMGGLAEAQLVSALQAMEQGDTDLAARVIGADGQVDGDEDSINEQVVRLLALRQPVADDLRLIMSSLKVASALERIADHATSTAHRVEVLRQSPHIPAIRSVLRLGWLVRDLLKESLDAFLAQDTDRAHKVRDSDREVDDLYSSLFRELLTYMMEDPRNITPCTHLMFIAKNLERVGDHATNLAEITCFIVTGQQVTGQRPKADQSSSMSL
ncbi:phosphate signaling complex protein PhoU [Haematospirillum sp. H1815]|uniref:phosphate signaling complex protein PhoU n=1 Tax=unclassified Haematospirillum TaxID=2622088 RepID=UPI00143BFB97|nr:MULTISPECIES: phosphate signaling complex protein PhoU [unclassified Haematospirillum]NKD77796.1 phosphate signaling complex protein PhoU [Haematospirillum sp. H1815]NKD87844.1 phosphate signaling complex protein PhoU [Haematospirillum sp. 15-248]